MVLNLISGFDVPFWNYYKSRLESLYRNKTSAFFSHLFCQDEFNRVSELANNREVEHRKRMEAISELKSKIINESLNRIVAYIFRFSYRETNEMGAIVLRRIYAEVKNEPSFALLDIWKDLDGEAVEFDILSVDADISMIDMLNPVIREKYLDILQRYPM